MRTLNTIMLGLASLGLSAGAVAAPSMTSPGQPTSKSVKPRAMTEAEAKASAAKAGFTRITAVAKDSSGIWHAVAYKGSQKVRVTFDDAGSISSEPMTANATPPIASDTANDRNPPKK